MPTAAEHVGLARRLREFFEESDPLTLPGKPLELAIAAAYWSSLHYIDAILANPDLDLHPAHDAERLYSIRAAGAGLKTYYRDYRELKTCYEDSIYRAVERTPDDLRLDIRPTFARIVERTREILGEQFE